MQWGTAQSSAQDETERVLWAYSHCQHCRHLTWPQIGSTERHTPTRKKK